MATVPNNPYMSDVYSVFSAPSGTPLSAFVRGGAYVPNIAANNGVPTSLPINLSDLAGATNYVGMSVSVTKGGGNEFRTEPAPPNMTVAGSLAPTVSGGTGSYTVTWSVASTGSVPSFSWSQSGNTFLCSGSIPKNTTLTPVAHLQVTDGVSTFSQNYNCTLTYSTDL